MSDISIFISFICLIMFIICIVLLCTILGIVENMEDNIKLIVKKHKRTNKSKQTEKIDEIKKILEDM